MGPPPRSYAADAYDSIRLRIHIGSSEYKCVAQGSAPDGELPSDRYADTYKATSEAGARRKARLSVHRPCACSGVKALRNTSFAKAARRQAALAFRSLDPFRALRELIAGDGTENVLSRSAQRTHSKAPTNSTRTP